MWIPDAAVEAAAKVNFELSKPRDWEDEPTASKAAYRAMAREQLKVTAPLLMGTAWASGAMEGSRWREQYEFMRDHTDLPEDQLPPYPKNPYTVGEAARTNADIISLLTGFSKERLDELGGVPRDPYSAYEGERWEDLTDEGKAYWRVLFQSFHMGATQGNLSQGWDQAIKYVHEQGFISDFGAKLAKNANPYKRQELPPTGGGFVMPGSFRADGPHESTDP